MISTAHALRLKDAGLEWVPREGDQFVIADRGLDDQVFSIARMTVEVRESGRDRRISFNGAVEWALDSISQSEVVWLPSETQLRDRLGNAFRSLRRQVGRYTCELMLDGTLTRHLSDDPSDAYALALLELLAHPELRLRAMFEGD